MKEGIIVEENKEKIDKEFWSGLALDTNVHY
jgi:hypothetical protein